MGEGNSVVARLPVRRTRLALECVAPLVLVALIGWKWPTVSAGAVTMTRADGEWLIVAAVAAALTWIAASGCQVGSTTANLPLRRVFAVQVAGSFVNHVFPAGLGTAGLNMRMLRRCGLTRERAADAIALNLAAGMVLHIVTLCVLVTVELSLGRGAGALGLMFLIVMTALSVLVCLGWLASRRFAMLRERLRALLSQSREVLRRPSRAFLLWSGSAAIPALHILTLIAVLHSLDQSASVVVVALAYLSASAISALIPSPGGFGGLDVALATALTADGLPAKVAVSAVIGYRLITVWIPLIPAAGSFLVLVHRHAV